MSCLEVSERWIIASKSPGACLRELIFHCLMLYNTICHGQQQELNGSVILSFETFSSVNAIRMSTESIMKLKNDRNNVGWKIDFVGRIINLAFKPVETVSIALALHPATFAPVRKESSMYVELRWPFFLRDE